MVRATGLCRKGSPHHGSTETGQLGACKLQVSGLHGDVMPLSSSLGPVNPLHSMVWGC